MHFSLTRLFSFAIVAFCTLPVVGFPNGYDPDRFEKSVVASGLIQPMEMAIAPDGLIYLIELGGDLKCIDPASNSVRTLGRISVTTIQENGLIGIALDPGFATNQWMYLQYSPPDFSGQRISRFTIRDGLLDLSSEIQLLQYEEQRQECCHHAGSMEFGPDGNLYIGTGDNTNPFGSEGFAPIDERQDKSAFNARRTSANTKSFNGKILRIRPLPEGGYAIPDGNLFPRDGSIGLPEIFVMGCRNPWRINVDQRSGFLYWGDVGPDAGGEGPRGPRGYDEVNQAKVAGNFGWPHFIANNKPYHDFDFTTGELGPAFHPDKPMNPSVFNSGAKELPPAQPAWIYYPAGNSKEFPELGSGGRTACAGPTFYYNKSNPSDTQFPEQFDRSLFIFEWSRNWIAAVHLNEDSGIERIEPFLPKTPFIRPIDLQFDAKGALYVLEYGETWGVNADAKLSRLEYRRGNRPPTVQIQSDRFAGREPLSIQLTSTGTVDKDRDLLQYRWSVTKVTDAQNTIVQGTPAMPKPIGDDASATATFESAGIYTVNLEVSDSNGGQANATTNIVVGNNMPEVRFITPLDGDFYDAGSILDYRVQIRDFEDGTSNPNEADPDELEFIDADAPKRVTIQANMVSANSSENPDTVPIGLKRIRTSDCLNCHAIDRLLVGPAFLEIANKYRDQPNAIAITVDRVQKGSSGVWGKVPMLPHAQHSQQEIRDMVDWVFALKPDPSSAMVTGVSNTVGLLQDKKDFEGGLRLTANYLDLGRDAIPALTGTKSIALRSRTIQAENASDIHSMQVLGSHEAGQGKFCGAINHGSYLRFDNIPIDRIGKLKARVTSAGSGGIIEARVGSVDGPVVARLPVKVNGSWNDWYEIEANWDNPFPTQSTLEDSASGKRKAVFLVCVNEAMPGGLMNIDWIHFGK